MKSKKRNLTEKINETINQTIKVNETEEFQEITESTF